MSCGNSATYEAIFTTYYVISDNYRGAITCYRSRTTAYKRTLNGHNATNPPPAAIDVSPEDKSLSLKVQQIIVGVIRAG